MTSLIPNDCFDALKELFGEKFSQLEYIETLALSTAYIEGAVTNSNLQEISEYHPQDLTKTLTNLVKEGDGKGKIYNINNQFIDNEEEILQEESNKEKSHTEFVHLENKRLSF